MVGNDATITVGYRTGNYRQRFKNTASLKIYPHFFASDNTTTPKKIPFMPKLPLCFLIFLLFSLSAFSQTDSLKVPIDSTFGGTHVTGYVAYPDSTLQFSEYGIASWYGPNWEGRMTSSHERFSPDSLTAAHKRLPFGTVVRVTNLSNDSVVYVKITDRLPRSSKRSIDLTPRVAKELNFYSKGLTEVKIEVVGTAPIYKAPKTAKVPPKKKK
jgi:rare lipoprotein A